MDLNAIRAAGYAELADQAKPALLLEAAADGPVVGRIGGAPRLPAGSPWPRSRWGGEEAEPMTFIAELDLARLDPAIWTGPGTGTLTFFCDIDAETLFIHGGGNALVLHHPPDAALVPLTAPDDLIEDLRSRPLSVTARAITSLPAAHADDRYWELRAALMGLGRHWAPTHQLLGTMGVLDDGMGEPWPELHRESVEAGHAPADERVEAWTVLLQVSSDPDRTGFEVGDGGTVVFAIPAADLEAGRFDRVEVLNDSA